MSALFERHALRRRADMRNERPYPLWRADLPVAEVPDIILDLSGQPYANGLLPRAVLDHDLQVIIPAWDMDPDPSIPDRIQVGWRVQGSPFVTVNSYDFYPPSQARTVAIPSNRLLNGVYDLSYIVSRFGNGTESLKRTITVDREAPNDGQEPAALIMPDDLVGELTEDYLDAQGRLRCRVPRYIGLAARDRALYFWSVLNPPPVDEQPILEQEFSQEDIDRDELIVSYDAALIRASGSGRRYLWYRLRDLAGNVGTRSLLAAVEVNLQPPPQNLLPPRVPLTARGLIDREHAREGAAGEGGVTVEIDRYDNADAAQRIVIDWNGVALSEIAVDPGAFPLRTFVSWSALVAQGKGPGTAQVSYQVRQGTRLIPSPATSVRFDLTVAGQDHPNAPALLNTLLPLVEIRGANSDEANVLKPIDAGLDAVATLQLFDDPHPGETLNLYWGRQSTRVATYTVQPGDVSGMPVSLAVPWRFIEQEPNDRALPVWYDTGNGVNQQWSGVTTVDVAVEVIRDLDPPVFPNATIYGYLNCCSTPRLWDGVNVRVEGDPRFEVGDTLELTWQGHDNLNGNSPIPGVLATFRKTVAAAGADVDFLILPYDTLIAPMIDNASATAWYRLLKGNGAVGVSDIDFVKITRKMPSGELCSPDNDVCVEGNANALTGECVPEEAYATRTVPERNTRDR